jgi:hypothetical protein
MLNTNFLCHFNEQVGRSDKYASCHKKVKRRAKEIASKNSENSFDNFYFLLITFANFGATRREESENAIREHNFTQHENNEMKIL